MGVGGGGAPEKKEASAPKYKNLHWFTGSFNVPFWIALPDRETDHNTNVIMNNWYEDPIGDAFRVMLSQRCVSGAQVLDIGANLGIFTATSAAFGCDVISVEAQSRLTVYLNETVRINHWDGPRQPRVTVKNAAIADRTGRLKIAYYDPILARESQLIDGWNKNWMSMAMDDRSLSLCSSVPGCRIEEVPIVEAHTLIKGNVILVKVDVDGPEATVIKSLLPALPKYGIESILCEICPGGWKEVTRAEGMDILRQLVEVFHYEVVLLDQIAFSEYKPGFLDRCHKITGVFRPVAYMLPADMFSELFEDATTKINCKNVLFVHSVKNIIARNPLGVLHDPRM